MVSYEMTADMIANLASDLPDERKLERLQKNTYLQNKIYQEILDAQKIYELYDEVKPSPCEKMRYYDNVELTNKDVYLKMEFCNKNKTIRRLCYALTNFKCKGIITVSAGNFAIDFCSFGREYLTVPVTVVMPTSSPLHKIRKCREYEGQNVQIIIEGKNMEWATKYAIDLAEEEGLAFFSEFDSEIIAGFGMIGLEIIEQIPDLDVLVVPNCYNGALIAGIAVAVKQKCPHVKIIGVNLEEYMNEKLKAKIKIDVHPIADELVYHDMNKDVHEIIKANAQLMSVSGDLIAHAVMKIVETERFIVEGSSAATLAAILTNKFFDMTRHKTRNKIVLLLNEDNFDPTIMNRCIYYGLYTENRLVEFTVPIMKQIQLIKLLQKLNEMVCIKRLHYNLLKVNIVCQVKDKLHLETLEYFLKAEVLRVNTKVNFQCPIGIL